MIKLLSAGQFRFWICRSMATLREIETRRKSIKNIEKITQTMKTVASTKLTKAQKVMSQAKAYGLSSNTVFENAETKSTSNTGKRFIVAVSSDKGLCGGVHSQIARTARKMIDQDSNSKLIVLGEKAKGQLARLAGGNIMMSFSQIGRDIPNFVDAEAIADEVLKQAPEFDKIDVLYNKYESAMTYTPNIITAYSEEAFRNSANFGAYEIEDDVLLNLKEFSLSNAIYWALAEGYACEVSARRNAMENASKNAGEVIEKLSITYNRQRQAVITNELIDIITGASAL